MPKTIEEQKAAEESALQLIDEALQTTVSRNLIPSDEYANTLLDLRVLVKS